MFAERKKPENRDELGDQLRGSSGVLDRFSANAFLDASHAHTSLEDPSAQKPQVRTNVEGDPTSASLTRFAELLKKVDPNLVADACEVVKRYRDHGIDISAELKKLPELAVCDPVLGVARERVNNKLEAAEEKHWNGGEYEDFKREHKALTRHELSAEGKAAILVAEARTALRDLQQENPEALRDKLKKLRAENPADLLAAGRVDETFSLLQQAFSYSIVAAALNTLENQRARLPEGERNFPSLAADRFERFREWGERLLLTPSFWGGASALSGVLSAVDLALGKPVASAFMAVVAISHFGIMKLTQHRRDNAPPESTELSEPVHPPLSKSTVDFLKEQSSGAPPLRPYADQADPLFRAIQEIWRHPPR